MGDTESIDEEENLEEELKLLLEEAEQDLSQDLKDKKHYPRSEEAETVTASTEESDKIKVVDETKTEDEAKDSEFELRKFWYEPSYIRFIQTIQVDEVDEEYFDTDYYPSSTIVYDELDYDEHDPEDVISQEELKGLQDDMKLDLASFGSYIPVWVHVDSVKVRKEAAKVVAEEKQKAAEEKQKEAAALKSSEEAASKGEKQDVKEEKPLDLKALDEAAAKLDAAESKPQRKLSAKSSPRKSPKKGSIPKSDFPKKTEEGSPKKSASPKSAGCANS